MEPAAPAPITAPLPERLLVWILAVAAVAVPHALRALDDNRLTSWSWVFAGKSPAVLFALVAVAALAAQLAPRHAPARHRALVLFVAAYAAGACLWSEPEPIVDAARYFTQAKHLERLGPGHFLRAWGREIPAWTDLPLVPFLYGLVLRASGESRLAVEAFTTLLFAGATVLTARLGAALWDEETGLAAGALLLAMPYLLAQVPLMLVDVPTLFFVTLALHASVRALRDGGTRAALLAGAALFLAVASKYSAALLLTAAPLAALALGRAAAPRRLRTAVLAAATALALALAWVLTHLDVHARQLALLLGYQAPGLRRWGESFLSTFLFQVHPLVTVAALASAWRAWRRRDARWVVAVWPLLVLLALGVRRARYLVPALPSLALAAAYGLGLLRARGTRRLVVASAVAGALVVALHGYLPFLRGTSAENLKDAGAWLDGQGAGPVEVVTAAAPGGEVNPAVSVPLLDLFTARPLVYRPAPLAPPGGPAAATSPLRFTWELGVAPWYAPGAGPAPSALALVSDGTVAPPPRDGWTLARTFDADEEVFGWRTRVAIYLPAPPPGAAPAPGALTPSATRAGAAAGGRPRPRTPRPCSTWRGRRPRP